MTLPILIATKNEAWGIETQKGLRSYGYEAELVLNGKDCQIRTSKVKFFAILLDFEIENYSAVEVLKFLKLSHPAMKILLLVNKKEHISGSFLDSKPLHRLGISEIIYGPLKLDKIKSKLVSLHGILNWKDVRSVEPIDDNRKIKDSETTTVSLKEFYSENVTLFDHYIRLAPNKYKKILNRGDTFSPERLKKYEEEGMTSLYILTSDRLNYINYLNTCIQKSLSKEISDNSKNLLLPLKSITIKFMEEVYTTGINPRIVEEGKMICQNMYDLILKDNDLNNNLKALQESEPTALTHSFIVSFFSIYICRQLDWAGRKTVDTIALGALLHDIGLMGLPANIKNGKISEFTPAQMALFQQHPQMGVDLLKRSTLADEALIQIIYQHHEHIDGSGFPSQISGSKVYPLAKIVSLADHFGYTMIENKICPKDAIKIILQDKKNLLKFDPMLMKNLVYGIAS